MTVYNRDVETKKPCGNEHCSKCYPWPVFRVSEHRVQHITYKRDIKAPSAEAALAAFNDGTAWPASYDDSYGEIVQRDPIQVEQLPKGKSYMDADCNDVWFNDAAWIAETKRFLSSGGDEFREPRGDFKTLSAVEFPVSVLATSDLDEIGGDNEDW